MLPQYTLYKEPVQTDTLAIVRYLYSQGIVLFPTVIVERNHPSGISLPAIYEYSTNTLYEGLDECVRFYEEHSGCIDLFMKANRFHSDNPDYRIH